MKRTHTAIVVAECCGEMAVEFGGQANLCGRLADACRELTDRDALDKVPDSEWRRYSEGWDRVLD